MNQIMKQVGCTILYKKIRDKSFNTGIKLKSLGLGKISLVLEDFIEVRIG